MIETMRAVAWILATLNASSGFTSATPGGVWRGVGPAEGVATSYPIAVVQFQAGSDVHGSNQARLWTDGLYIVKAVGPADDDVALVACADAIDTALQDLSGTAQGGTVMSCLRERPFGPLDEVVNGQRFTNVGGIYRLLARPS